jgi:hypothetical protein
MDTKIAPWVVVDGLWRLEWYLDEDLAVLRKSGSAGGKPAVVWTGSLLPAFELSTVEGKTAYVKAAATGAVDAGDTEQKIGLRIALSFGAYGSGSLNVRADGRGVRFTALSAYWTSDARVVSMQFGTRLMDEVEKARAPRLDRPYWPNWSSEGYCVPAAGSSPTQSYFRSWDMGDALLPLGSFGDAMGTPYSAAFPRPMYAAAMGGRNGWLAFGSGEIPDAPLTLHLQSVTASLRYAYREDLWGAADTRSRIWNEPLRLSWGNSGYEAMAALYATFGPFEPKSPHHARSFICTWGDFKEGRYDLKQLAHRASGSTRADMVILDDHWETYNGSGEPNLERFPDFEADLAGLRSAGFDIALWQSVGWVDDPTASGLTTEDLLCGADGVPRQWRWSGSPIESGGYHYLLDPSSERTRALIKERVQRLIAKWRPAALKLDFGYGFPGSDVCAPRDPAYRGERLAYHLLKLTYDAAKEVDPLVTIIYYGITPLLRGVTDLISLDDLGDAGDSATYELAGHNQRCLWASLAAAHGMPINTSTGYYWDTFESILLDTAVVGTNGLTLGEFDSDGKRITATGMNRWAALHAWRRRSCGWMPLWLDADTGSLKGEPKLLSWGRVEGAMNLSEGDSGERASMEVPSLTALALRIDGGSAGGIAGSESGLTGYEQVPYLRFSGNWALIAQDDLDLESSAHFACIPFKAGTLALEGDFASVQAFVAENGLLVPLGEPFPAAGGLRLEVSAERLYGLAGYIVRR